MTTPSDPRFGGLPIGGGNGRPVPAAYEVNGAIQRGCGMCGVGPGEWCINVSTGSTRKIPCMIRLHQSV